MTLRLIDHLCRDHAQQAESRWPIAGDLRALFDQCWECEHITARLHPDGSYHIRSLPTLDFRTYDQLTALHESAHAVLGLVARMPLNYACIEPRTADLQIGFSGCVNWGDFSIPFDEWAAMCWAGQQAQMRWLAATGRNTAANRVDVANLGWDDTRQVLESAAEHRISEDTGWDLCGERLDQHWASIERVADALLAAARLSGAEIADLAGLEVAA